ncbi:MAG: AtpZ/AtpI family protein [Acidobacteriota bacterium]
MNVPVGDGGKRLGKPDRSAAKKMNARVQATTVLRGGRYIAMATQLPFAIFGGYAVGYGLDYYFGTTWLRIFCLFAAIIGAFVQLILQVLNDQSKPLE